jgi:hypothetical protein
MGFVLRTLGIMCAVTACLAQQPPSASLPDAPQPQTSQTEAAHRQKKPKDPPKPGSCRDLWIDTPAEAPLRTLTPHQKFKLAGCDFMHPFTYIVAAADSGISVAVDPHSGYGPGGKGIAKHFGVDMTDELSNDFFGVFLFPTVFRQDPHYHALGKGHPVRARVKYAMTRVLIAKRDDGEGKTINAGEIFGTIATSTLANTYHPNTGQGFNNTAPRVAISIASDAGYNIWKEYAPQITTKLKLRLDVARLLVQKINFSRQQP